MHICEITDVEKLVHESADSVEVSSWTNCI
jgi:hypothetical protein